MPIPPERMKLYPGGSINSPEWKAIRARILERSKERSEVWAQLYGEEVATAQVCECTGECGVDHKHDEFMEFWGCGGYDDVHLGELGRCQAYNGSRHPVTGSMVVLTIAHLDHDPTHSDDDNLKAMCQRCHLRLDADTHHQTCLLYTSPSPRDS